ncbi:HAD domain-containing protein [Duganella sp. HH105]|uniref:HAD domain-containing protein n=1 Tax=Duganella sp. HH105 TaxID=1781067 RepID=UPI000A060E19|nr:HAD domain-containing protein [Duganella sp. HH105]
MSYKSKQPLLVLDEPTPTIFLDYDGTLHRGCALLDESGELSLDSGNSLFEFTPLLVHLLEPYPHVEIVLTTSWVDAFPLEKVISYLPLSLAKRVVGTTHDIKVPFGYLQDGSARTYRIRSYVFAHRLKNWLALDDSVYGAFHLNTTALTLEPHLVLLDTLQGINTVEARTRVSSWLAEVHNSAG